MDKVNLGKECAVEENVDTINGSESEISTNEKNTAGKYFTITIVVSLGVLLLLLIEGLIHAGIGNVIYNIFLFVVASFLFKVSENAIIKGFFGLGAIGTLFDTAGKMLGKYGVLIIIVYIILVIVAAYIADKYDKKESGNC